MVFNVLLWLSLTVCLLGCLYRVHFWFFGSFQGRDKACSGWPRIRSAWQSLFPGIFKGASLGKFIRGLVDDALLLRRTRTGSWGRFVMHSLMFWGFLYLLVFHALESVVTAELFSGYQSTLNPWFFLRDLAGLLVLAGVFTALIRRIKHHVPSAVRDWIALALVGGIVVSGFFLEAVKITSVSEFDRMVTDYSPLDDPADVAALEAFWTEDNGLISPRVALPVSDETLQLGEELNEMFCVSCHAPASGAPASYFLSRAISPMAVAWDHFHGIFVLRWVHILLSLGALAFLPWTKLFHMVATPIGLITARVSDGNRHNPVNALTRAGLDLDSCTHCGACSATCSAMAAAWTLENDYVLPGQKMQALGRLFRGESLTAREAAALRQGVSVCSGCGRCTAVCPSGIDLQSLWNLAGEVLIQKYGPEVFVLSPFSFAHSLRTNGSPAHMQPRTRAALEAVQGNFRELNDSSRSILLESQEDRQAAKLSRNKTFSYCFGCQTCTTVCPVVMSFEHPEEELGLLPHQIMCCLGLGQTELASGSRMIWECLTCYKCQEYCPQQVRIVDLFYRLKHAAAAELQTSRQEV